MKRNPILLVLAAAAFIGGCAHTNNLAKYNVSGQKALFRAYMPEDAASAVVDVASPSSNTFVQVIAAVGSGIASDQARKKLQHAVNGDSIVHSLQNGMISASTDYLQLQPVASLQDNPTLIVETHISSFKFISTTAGLNLEVTGRSRMIDRATGGLVWDNDETRTISLSQLAPAVLGPALVQTGASLYNAVDLMSMSQEEIQRLVNAGATEAGRELAESLRHDVAKMHGAD